MIARELLRIAKLLVGISCPSGFKISPSGDTCYNTTTKQTRKPLEMRKRRFEDDTKPKKRKMEFGDGEKKRTPIPFKDKGEKKPDQRITLRQPKKDVKKQEEELSKGDRLRNEAQKTTQKLVDNSKGLADLKRKVDEHNEKVEQKHPDSSEHDIVQIKTDYANKALEQRRTDVITKMRDIFKEQEKEFSKAAMILLQAASSLFATNRKVACVIGDEILDILQECGNT